MINNCLIINKCVIDNISWFDINYPEIISKLNSYELCNINNENFNDILNIKLNLNEYNIPNLEIINEIIEETEEYIYELLYIDLKYHKIYQNEINGIGTLLNTNGENIYSKCILLKTHISTLNIVLININDIQNILYNRINTKIITWDEDNKWKEEIIIGELNIYAKQFFEDYDYKKIEIGFLMHNINIWYLPDKYGEKNICGNLLLEPIEKCIFFTMKSDEYRGNITLDEVKKIIYLSTKLSSYNTPNEYLNEKNDDKGRKIINNKFTILNSLFNYYS
jgi:hypothetical protein